MTNTQSYDIIAGYCLNNDSYTQPNSKAYSHSPYSFGYNHGCYYTKISNADDKYINLPGKGANYHTFELMDGYEDGLYDCFQSTTQSN